MLFETKKLCFKDFICYTDLVIEDEKINFIVGPSGSGKSTLLKLFNKTQEYSLGDIFYQGKSLSEYKSISLRREVNLVSQSVYLFPGTVRENFELYYRYCECELELSDERMKKFLLLAEADFDVEECCDNMSGGERQRIYIAICISMEARVIMLDEPTSALDEETSEKVLGNIIQYVKESARTLVVISHNNYLAERYSENTITL